MAIFGAISITEFGAFLISSKGISSDLGRGILGDPSLDLILFPELSLDRPAFSFLPSSFLKLPARFGLSASLKLQSNNILF